MTGSNLKGTYELDEALANMEGVRFVLVVQDYNGLRVQLGSKDQGLVFGYERDSGQTPNNPNATSWTFRGKTNRRPIPFTQNIVVASNNDDTVGLYSSDGVLLVSSDGFVLKSTEQL